MDYIMKKRILLLLTMLFVSVLSFAEVTDYPYHAKVVNVSSTLNIRQGRSTKSAIVGKLEKDDIVKCQLSASELYGYTDWVAIQHENIEGYVKANYLTPIEVAPPTQPQHNVRGNTTWIESYRFYIMLALAIAMIVLSCVHNHSFGAVMCLLGLFTLLLWAAWYFVLTDEYVLNDIEIFGNGGVHWAIRIINLLILGVYMCALIVGYLATCYGIASIATTNQKDYNAVSVSFFLWLFPLLVVCLYFPWALIVVVPLALWKFGLNCKLMWPYIHYPFIILVLGLVTCLVVFYLFITIISQIIIAGIFALIIISVLKGSAPKISSSSYGRYGEKHHIREAANGDPWTTDANGNTVWLRKTDSGYDDYKSGNYYDENGYKMN